ncbi:MAG TPA: two-component regulator propeller domain-containing protein, partial [Terriglobales bacterium]|nr:two-component regulator propeller domain-containing protein [Terriglobales bacterium]
MAQSWKAWLRLAGAVAGALVLAAAFVGWRATRALRTASREVLAERGLRFAMRTLGAPQDVRFEPVSAPEVFLETARFQDHLYIASPAGLLEYDSNGTPLRQFLVGRELPSSPLVALAPAVLADSHEPELLLATAQDGVLAFNGRSFRQIYPQEPEARDITCLLPVSSGHLLIGTKKRGVLLYDGKQITPLHPTLGGLYVQALSGNESDLWVGTLSQGVLHWHAGATETFGEKEGLPDPQVQAIAAAEEKTYVGTVLGVAEFDRGRFSRVVAPGVLVTSLLPQGDNLIVGSEDQGVISVPLAGRRASVSSSGTAELSEVRQVLDSGDAVYVLTRKALFQMRARGFGWKQVLQPGAALLSDRNVSALAVDGRGRVWVGTLSQGVLHWHAGATETFGEKEGLPDPQVQPIAAAEEKTYVGTVLGVAEFDRGRFSRVVAPGV